MSVFIGFAKILPKILPNLLGNITNITYICIVIKLVTSKECATLKISDYAKD